MNLLLLVSLSILWWAIVGPAISETLKVEWSNQDLQNARDTRVNLLGPDYGFEASGSAAGADSHIPIIGVLPSELAAVFQKPASGFESAPRVEQDYHQSGVEVKPIIFPSKLQYTIAYTNIAPALDAVCGGRRLVRPIPPGLTLSPEEGHEEDRDVSSDQDGAKFVSAQENRYGIPYSCDLYCSAAETWPYCQTDKFVREMLKRATLLAPGQPD